MNLRNVLVLSTLGLSLVGCNTTGIDKQHPETVVSAQAYQSIAVYPARADVPRHARVLGKVTAQNKLPNGMKASPEAILIELKRQAVLLGANGIVRVTPGLAQTTADAVLTR